MTKLNITKSSYNVYNGAKLGLLYILNFAWANQVDYGVSMSFSITFLYFMLTLKASKN